MEEKKIKYYSNSRPDMLKLIPSTSKKTLEIGCGRGNFSSQLVQKGVETWGIEPNKISAENAQEKLFKVLVGTLDEMLNQLPDNYFDAIILNDVLEHLIYPWEDMKNLKGKLSDNGVLISSIPNVRYAKNLFHLLLMKNWEYKESGILDSTHFRFFTKKSIISMHKKSGYTIQKIKGINVTKSVLFFPFALIVNIFFLFTQLDIFYMQYATVAIKSS
ncbi:MAG: class I SAM-dependent methyltransferase [Flavobacteriaceae bacterium]|nr:class I SAM-dependent methyltransferase [Flavobacteriaceae bacterium]